MEEKNLESVDETILKFASLEVNENSICLHESNFDIILVQGDIWAESRVMGFLWHYYACMEGAVYDVTEWAACQAANLKHLRANTHSVQYRIVSGQRPRSQTSGGGKRRQQSDPSTR